LPCLPFSLQHGMFFCLGNATTTVKKRGQHAVGVGSIKPREPWVEVVFAHIFITNLKTSNKWAFRRNKRVLLFPPWRLYSAIILYHIIAPIKCRIIKGV
jgi:hypothetical protein